MRCEWCVRRPAPEGGNGTCPVFHRATVHVLHPGSLKSREEKQPVAEAWKHHLTVYPSGCVNFKAGDRRVPAPPAEQGGLF